MKSKTAKRNFIALAVVAIIGLLAMFISFNVPFTTQTYNGFLKGLPLSNDLAGGVVAYFDTSENESATGNYEDNLNSVVSEFNTFLSESFSVYSVIKTEDGIRVEVPNLEDIASNLDIIDGAGSIEFKATEDSEPMLTGEHIKSAEFYNNNGEPGVIINFTTEGKALFYELTTAQAGSSIYVYVGGEVLFNPSIEQGLNLDSTIISGSMTSDLQAQAYAFKINASRYGVNLNLNGDIVTSQPLLGENGALILVLICSFLFAVAVALLILKFKELGLISGLTLSLQFVLFMLLLNVVPNLTFSFTTVIGIIVVLALSVLSHLILFNKLHAEFKTGKKIAISLKLATKPSLVMILDYLMPVFVSGLVLVWFTLGVIKNLAIILTIGTLFIGLFTFVVLLGLIKIYLHINPKDYKKFGYNNVEVADEK